MFYSHTGRFRPVIFKLVTPVRKTYSKHITHFAIAPNAHITCLALTSNSPKVGELSLTETDTSCTFEKGFPIATWRTKHPTTSAQFLPDSWLDHIFLWYVRIRIWVTKN